MKKLDVVASGDAESGNVNDLNRQKQVKVGAAVIGAFMLGIYLLITVTSTPKDDVNNIKSDDLTETVQRRPGDKDSFELLSRQVNGLLGDVNKFRDTTERMNMFLEAQGEASVLDEINASLNANAGLLEDLTLRMDNLDKKELSTGGRKTFGQSSDVTGRPSGSRTGSGAIPARPTNTDDIFAPRGRNDVQRPNSSLAPRPVAAPTTRKQNVIELYSRSEGSTAAADKEAELKGFQTKAAKPDVFDTENYVPPNAYVSARLVVSVDAAIGNSQASDPKAAQFIITGAAKHVQDGRRIEETDLDGCLVNGSAQGNLSSERVFINLHAMTCPLGNGRVAVSKVEGYATHLGKNGIRGTVVSREGDLVTQAILAGALEGLGRTAGQASNSFGISGGAGGSILGERPDAGDILTGSAGSGVAAGAGVYSQYLLERAQAYEPVVSLPTGIEVELVFISGTLVRPIDE